MTIEAKHFDTRINQWIHLDGNTDNPASLLKEEINNTLLEHFLPGTNFSFGHIDEKSTAQQLKNHPSGHKLLLSSKTRLLYGPEECLDTIRQLCPDNKDRGAYGSIFLGSCKNAINRELNILIVDDSHGENGGIINNDQAYRLTGDCYGQISTELYHQITGHQESDQYRIIQHRFGWTDQDGDDTKYRFGKGTLRPANLDQILNYQDPNHQTKIDLILPISSFKGTDKDNPSGPTKPQIKPGLYTQNIWLGEKSESELGKTAISQLLASFPNGMKDFTEQLELEAQKLKKAQDDPRQLAQLYCEKYEKRKAFLAELAAVDEPEENPTLEESEIDDTDSFIYKLIKADVQGQLLETEKVQRELARFVQNEWKEIAIGKTLTFERAMIIPSKDLQNGEIYIPHYQDGEQVLNFRSPFLNSNGLCTSINKAVEDVLGPDGKPLAGAIAVSDETSDRIYNRLNNQIKSIQTEAQGKNIQIEGIENYLDKNIGKLETKDKIEFTKKFNDYIKELQTAGYKLETLPQESEQERQARDYDGDCIGFDKARKYPNLTAEAIERNLEENAYDPTVKLKKQSFYREDGSQPEFEKIALHMSDGISVGVINNHLTTIEGLESEITILKKFGSEKDQVNYVQQVAEHYTNLFAGEAVAKSKGISGKEVRDKYRGYMSEFVQIARQPQNQETAFKAMSINTKMYREMIAEAAFQNQIAVDLFKSAKTPEMEIIRSSSQILHRQVNYIRDKKKKDVYLDHTIQPTGSSPVELVISKTNEYFEKARLESRPLVQFQDLFAGVEFSYQQRLQCAIAKKEFDELFNRASSVSRQKDTESGPSVNLTLGNDNQVKVTNLLRYDNEFIWKAHKITFKLTEIPEEKRNSSRPHKYLVFAQINDETENENPKFRTLGTLAQEQENHLQEIGIAPEKAVSSNKISFSPELGDLQIKLLYQQAYQAAENFYNSIPSDQKLGMAAASWAVSTTRESHSGDEQQKKVSNFVFAAFPQEIIGQLYQLQFTEFSVTNFDRSQVFETSQNVRFNLALDGKSVIEIQNQEENYKTFGNIEQNDGRLPIGTTATATLEKGEIYTYSVSVTPELTFKVGELNRFGTPARFNNEPVALTIEKVDLSREDYAIYLQNGNKLEKLGNLDKESVKEGIAQGWLVEKPGNGQQIKLKLQTVTTGQNAYAIARTTQGHLLRVNITNPQYKKHNVQDQEFREASVRAFDKKHVYVAKICEQVIGTIGQHTERLGFKGNARKDKSTIQKLIDAGVLRESQQRTTVSVQITSNESTAKISINPETIKYPDQWIKSSQLTSDGQQKTPDTNHFLLAKINQRPTMMFQAEEQQLTGFIGLAVDEQLGSKTKEYLEKSGVSSQQLPVSQARLEEKKGMTVFMLDASTINEQLKQKLTQHAGGHIKSADEYLLALKALPIRPKQLSQSEIPVPIEEEEIKSSQPDIAVQAVQASSETKKLYENNAYLAKAAETSLQVETALQNSTCSLNLGQKAALKKMVAFSQQPVSGNIKDNEFLLTGYAGTGKTYVIQFKEQVFVLSAEREREVEALKLQHALATLEPPIVDTPSFSEQPQTQTNSQPLENTILTPLNGNQPIRLPSSHQADQTKAIEILGQLSPGKVVEIRSHLETHLKPVLEVDKSSYAPGRLVAWIGTKWDLKEKDFKPGVQDDTLMQLVKQVYPEADIALVTYSENPKQGIDYHRDDSYAAIEARSINIENSEWGYRAAKEQMVWTREENTAALYQEFKLESGTVTRFNCKNEHAAINTEAGRWSINIWSIKNDQGKENSVRQKFENFLTSNQPPRAVVHSNNDLTIKSDEWTPGGEIQVERSYNSFKVAKRNIPASSTLQPSVEELIAIGEQTKARTANPQIPEKPTISGRTVPMVYSLHLHGEPSKVPVNTTIDAMRHGRVHTTRGVDYQKTYGIKEGDIAIAVGKNSEQVAFRVGKQYEITPQMIESPAYQQAWANWEKHSPLELTQNQASKSKVFGLFMEPLGDYVNGKIIPFPSAQKRTTSINISPNSSEGLGAALANATTLAKEQGKLQSDYQVSVRNNPEAPAGQYGVETHLHKPEGVAYASAEHAFYHQKQLHPNADECQLMVEVLQAKLEQHPRLIDTIAKRGGTEWLENCTALEQHPWLIEAIAAAYTNVVEKSQLAAPETRTSVETATVTIEQPVVTVTPVTQLKVISGGQTGADLGALIGAKALGLPTGGTAPALWMTEDGPNPNLLEYGLVEGEKGDSASQTYQLRTVENIRNSDGTAIFGEIKSSGSRVTLQKAQDLGKPVLLVPLETALNHRPTAAKQLADFVETNNIQTLNIAGNRESKAPGLQAAVAEIVQMGLLNEKCGLVEAKDHHEKISSSTDVTTDQRKQLDIEPALLKPSHLRASIQGVMDDTLEQVKENMVKNLQDWYVVAQQLGKSENYLSRIQAVTDSYIQDHRNTHLHSALVSMEKDIKELHNLNEMTVIAQYLVQKIGYKDINGITSCQTEKYQVATKAESQTYLVKDKNEQILLYIKSGKTMVNNMNQENQKDFRFMKFRTEHALENIINKELVI